MALKFLLDENFDKAYQHQFLRQSPESVMWVVGDPGASPRGTLDPEILIWCEEHDFILVTNNRKSMPIHLNDHIAIGRHVPGILLLNVDFSISRNLEELFLIAEYAFEDEYQDRIVHLPLPENLE